MRPLRLPEPACDLGYPEDQLQSILGAHIGDFWRFMNGQTQGICDGRRFDHNTRTYAPSPCGGSHGAVVYQGDLERFMVSKGIRPAPRPRPVRRRPLGEVLAEERTPSS